MKLLSLLLLTSIAVAQTTAPKLPAELTIALTQDFPGWKPAPIDSQVQQENKDARAVARRGFISGDFDGDGRADYVVMLLHPVESGSEEQVAVAYLSTKSGWQKHLLLQTSSAMPSTYLTLSRRGEACYDFDKDQKFKCPSDVVNLIYSGQAGITYIFRSGKFDQIISGD